MIFVRHYTNPFKPATPATVKELTAPASIADCRRAVIGADEFSLPTICLVNGQPVLRSKWGLTDFLRNNDRVNFVVQPGDPFTIITALVVSVVASIAIAALSRVNRPRVPGQLPEPASVFTLAGQQNQNRLTFPIPCAYGRNRMWPDYAAQPYNQYIGNDQYLFALFCIGQGYHDIEAVQIEDTNIASFADVTYEVYDPGEIVTLFPDNVVTSVEVSNIELLAPNEPSGGAFTGAFVVNAANTQTDRIEVDLTFPLGLYKANGSGGLDPKTGAATFEYRPIDDNGVPTGAGTWSTLFTFTKTLATTTPQRFTVSTTVTAGRYQVRGKRTDTKDLSASAANQLNWETVRAFLPSTQDYGKVTLLAIKAKASNNLNSNASNRINVIATRKLRVYSGGSWSSRTATRAFGPAFADIVMSAYGGRLNSSFIDLAGLEALDTTYAERGDTFNYVFDSKSTVWEALAVLCRAGRGAPVMLGSIISMVRDAPKTIPTAIFTPDNIIKGSFQHQLVLADMNEFDGLTVEYMDEDTWKPETVDCILPGEFGDNPDYVKLPGVTNRAQAYREGMYLRACSRYLRQNVVFKTGLEGFAPVFGDLLGVAYDVPRWGDYGTVLDITGDVVTLSKDVVFEPDQTYQLALRKKDGSQSAAFTVTEGDAPNKVVCGVAPDLGDFFLDRHHEPLIFQFGLTSLFSKLCTLSSFTPSQSGQEPTEIAAVIVDDQVHAFDDLPTPPRNSVISSASDLPVVARLDFVTIADVTDQMQASWTPAIGATAYLLQQSYDGITWVNVITLTGTSYTVPIITGYLYLRVAAFNIGVGSWAYWEGFTGVASAVPGNPASVNPDDYTSTFFRLSWAQLLTAAYYQLKVCTGPTVHGTLTTRTSNTVGTITVSSGHGIANGSLLDIYWAAGKRASVLVGTTGSTTIPITVGSGDNLPSTSTAIVIVVLTRIKRTMRFNALLGDYTNVMAVADGTPVRDLYFLLMGVNNIGESRVIAESGLVTNPLPVTPGSPTSALKTAAPTLRTYTAQWDANGDDDFLSYRVYGSFTNGFTPGGGNLLHEGIDSEFDIAVAASGGHHAAYYWRVVTLDVWGTELTNISAQQTIAAV